MDVLQSRILLDRAGLVLNQVAWRFICQALKTLNMEIPQPDLKTFVKPAFCRQSTLEQWEIKPLLSFSYKIAKCCLTQQY